MNNNQMRIILNDRKNKLRCLSGDYCYLKNIHENKCEENDMYQMENAKLKDHMMILTKQNDNLSYEIDNIIKEDSHMKDILNRSDRMSKILKSNDSIICQMIIIKRIFI
jgi:regulator of replication initiation timing